MHSESYLLLLSMFYFNYIDTNSWVDPGGVRISKVVKAADQPQFGFDFVSQFKPKEQNIKIVFWCIDKPLVGKEKEYIIGTAKLDYQFFRSWYLSGILRNSYESINFMLC